MLAERARDLRVDDEIAAIRVRAREVVAIADANRLPERDRRAEREPVERVGGLVTVELQRVEPSLARELEQRGVVEIRDDADDGHAPAHGRRDRLRAIPIDEPLRARDEVQADVRRARVCGDLRVLDRRDAADLDLPHGTALTRS